MVSLEKTSIAGQLLSKNGTCDYEITFRCSLQTVKHLKSKEDHAVYLSLAVDIKAFLFYSCSTQALRSDI